MLLDGVNFDSGDEFERDGASPSPKKKNQRLYKKGRGERKRKRRKGR